MIHNKIISEQLHQLINKMTAVEWDDVSYGHDDTDSLESKELDLIIFLPNFVDYTSFRVMFSSEYGKTNGEEFFNLKDLVVFTNKLL
jgi:hypothetical protein